MSELRVAHLTLKYPLFGKDRQRFNRKTGTVYQPASYRNDQKALRQQLRAGWGSEISEYPVVVDAVFCGHGKGDVDNTLGGLLDAMVGVVIPQDTKRWVPRISADWYSCSDKSSTWLVRIEQIPHDTRSGPVDGIEWVDFDSIYDDEHRY